MSINKNINDNLCTATLTGLSELEHIRNMVISCSKKFGFDDKISFKIALAIDEACSNLIKYTFSPNESKEIIIQVTQKDDALQIIILDESEPFDPKQIESPDMNEYFKEFRRGGLGIHLIKLIIDEIHYIPRSESNKYNTLILRKKLPN